MHLSIFISVINQLDAQNFCFTISFFHASTCFEHICSSLGGQNCLWYHHTYRCDDTRGCVMQFWPPDDEHMFSKHVDAWNKFLVKQKKLCIKLVNYWDKYYLWMLWLYLWFFVVSYYLIVCISSIMFFLNVKLKTQNDKLWEGRVFITSAGQELLTALTPIVTNICILWQRNRVQVSMSPLPEP